MLHSRHDQSFFEELKNLKICRRLPINQSLTCGRFDQRGSTEEDGSLLLNYNALVRHGGYIGPAGGTRTHHYSYLTKGTQLGRIVVGTMAMHPSDKK